MLSCRPPHPRRTAGGVVGPSCSTLIFGPPPSLASISPTSMWGLGVSVGLSVASVLGGVGADAVVFSVAPG